MSLENLVKEVRSQAADRISEIRARTSTEKKAIEDERLKRATQVREEEMHAADRETHRETTRIVAAANLHAKKLITDAKERRIEQGYELLREKLLDFTKTQEYEKLVASMAIVGLEVLGDEARIRIRPEDLSRLPPYLQTTVLKDRPIKTMGGLIVESRDGRRKLDMTFEELLRLREDAVREILSKR